MTRTAMLTVLSGLLAWLVARWVCHRASSLNLVQTPNHRSSHTQPTPNGGGLGIVVAASVVGAVLQYLHGGLSGWVVLGIALILALAGLRDDMRPVSARLRFAVQLSVCAALLFVLRPLPVVSLLPLINLDISSWLLFVLLIIMGVWWINLFNFMDGIDGLAGMQSIFMLMSAAALAWLIQPAALENPAWVWMICTAAATFGFLCLNWPPAKIFMGDVGSTWLAFMLFAFALLSIQAGWLSYTSWLILSAVFVTDATMTLLVRMRRGDRWHQAHKSHAYQRLSRHWKNNRKTGHQVVTLIVAAINILWLLPLSAASLLMPNYSWLWLLLAYAPIAMGTFRIGAGRSEHA